MSQLRPLALVHWQASWSLSTLTGQDVSLSEEESPPEPPFVAGRGPLPGPETGLLPNTRKCIVPGDTCANKARDFIGKWHLGGEQEGKGTQENSAAWLTVLGFMVMGFSGLSLASHSNSESFLVVHASLSQDGC